MNSTYCNENCPIGRAAKEVFLDLNNSAYDAVFDFKYFVDNCYNRCPFKHIHNKSEISEK
jgi:hypothetical protein